MRLSRQGPKARAGTTGEDHGNESWGHWVVHIAIKRPLRRFTAAFYGRMRDGTVFFAFAPQRPEPMRVLHAYRTYFPDTQGGVEETIRQICLNTRSEGVESRVLCLSPQSAPAVLAREEADVHRLPSHLEVASCTMSLAAPAAMRRLSRWADVVHYHFPWPFADMLHFGVGVRPPAVLTYHSDIVRQRLLEPVYRPLMNRFLGAMSRIACTSPNYLASSPVLPHFADKVDVVPIGLSPEAYPVVGEEMMQATGAKFGAGFFLYLGVLRYYKSVHALLDAIAGAPFRVVIAGEGPEGPSLRRQAERLRLDNVTFAGRVSDETKVALLRLCRALVFPSAMRSEAFGVTLLEAAMQSRPMISTEQGTGTSYVNLHDTTGLVVPPNDPSALRHAMQRLHADSSLATKMGKQARHRFDAEFTGERMGQRYARIYRNVAGGWESAD